MTIKQKDDSTLVVIMAQPGPGQRGYLVDGWRNKSNK